MSKRSYEEFSTIASNSRYLSVLDHADNLLKAAQSLKQDLERLRSYGDSPSYEKILSALKQHNAQIHPAAQLLLQDETTAVSTASDSTHKIQKVDQHRGPSNGHPQSGLPIPHPVQLTKWTPQDVPDADVLPPLPPALDPILEKASRTHPGIAGGLGEMDYERLEWIGDAYLYLVSSAFIYQTFPNLSAGRSSQLRERLIKNEALSELTVRYNLDKRARLPIEYQPGGRPSLTGAGTSASKKERKKILGDLLEAYMAAAILGDADGLPRVVTWLKPVWGTILKREIRSEYEKSIVKGYPNPVRNGSHFGGSSSAQSVPGIPAKAALSQIIGTKGVRISYQDEGQPKKDKNSGLPWFTVGAYYDGLGETNLNLGYGGGLSKKEAGENAAVKALQNKKLIKRLQKLREDTNATLIDTERPRNN
ncbi:ribonuclease III domain-containing protein [Xylaria sp. FL1777]|nr:ribonuclease III domain-containing protein [Xylaria sp. FL1777]